jgi:hypothetical protein
MNEKWNIKTVPDTLVKKSARHLFLDFEMGYYYVISNRYGIRLPRSLQTNDGKTEGRIP